MASENPNTPTDLFSSAQGIAGAAQAKAAGAVDYVKKGYGESEPSSGQGIAGAAQAKVTDAADYVKKGYGESVEKAQTFIKQHESSGEKPKEESSGVIGDYVKKAQGFFK